MNLPRVFAHKIRSGILLRRRTTLGIGGEARGWFEPKDTRELTAFLASCRGRTPIVVIGAGSNLLVKAGLIEKIFVRLSKPFFRSVDMRGCRVSVGAGVPLAALVRRLAAAGLTGYEFLAGIPGTMGGAVVMNAGARTVFDKPGTYREIKDIVESVDAVGMDGRCRTFTKRQIRFSYRDSSLTSFVIVTATLRLRKGSSAAAGERIRRILKARRERQDRSYPSAGSFFKNPASSGETAGRLIDGCGLKGACVGGACVSSKHANFILNKGGATYADVKKLMDMVQKAVYHRYKIHLKPEVKIVV
ncbi:MAG: UDP-N-acetylmuramate dehydrogenase [Candidatus Omnitrophica bacterium]|nr:UDP-N-acetylmuramate dehydrogenase [Candidatus Omnitrophota bacterium]